METLPASVSVPETEYWEYQQMARDIDRIRRKLDPDFKGAFHEKKRKKQPHPIKRNRPRKK